MELIDKIVADDAAEALVSFCKTRLDPKRLKGIYTAPWKFTIPDTPEKKNITKTLEGIDLFAAAMDKHFRSVRTET